MREIKFRAWDTPNKKMRSVDGLDFGNILRVISKSTAKHRDDLPDYAMDGGYELMQYTGLKDKNGKEIL